MDRFLSVAHPDGEKAGRTSQNRIWPVVEGRQRWHVAVAADQVAVGGAERVRDGFWGALVCCGVMAGLGPAGDLADGAQGLQLLVKAVGWQCLITP